MLMNLLKQNKWKLDTNKHGPVGLKRVSVIVARRVCEKTTCALVWVSSHSTYDRK